jgi:hypothetical protein
VNFAAWCCAQDDENGLWNTKDYNTDSWVEGIKTMSERYINNSYVVGFDLKNEFHDYKDIQQTYGTSSDKNTDWKVASELAGSAVLHANPKLLVIAGGMCFNYFLKHMHQNPPVMPVKNKLGELIS